MYYTYKERFKTHFKIILSQLQAIDLQPVSLITLLVFYHHTNIYEVRTYFSGQYLHLSLPSSSSISKVTRWCFCPSSHMDAGASQQSATLVATAVICASGTHHQYSRPCRQLVSIYLPLLFSLNENVCQDVLG